MELTKLTTEELKVIATEKNEYGSATTKALKAQSIIWERADRPYNSTYFINHKKYTSNDYSYLE